MTHSKWLLPFTRWSSDELRNGLQECELYGWRNLARQIRNELRRRA